ncbi:unnamed protein product [Heligmosomoides polygyrus]|uniref:ZP domain-containing protein n=1 Tax=Heligmosomoides polygyrus TaxID=6339 RepID=A0A3P8AX26_HELPZ|nr:unnamed protein product [Heligmosomoides polygyrus]
MLQQDAISPFLPSMNAGQEGAEVAIKCVTKEPTKPIEPPQRRFPFPNVVRLVLRAELNTNIRLQATGPVTGRPIQFMVFEIVLGVCERRHGLAKLGECEKCASVTDARTVSEHLKTNKMSTQAVEALSYELRPSTNDDKNVTCNTSCIGVRLELCMSLATVMSSLTLRMDLRKSSTETIVIRFFEF